VYVAMAVIAGRLRYIHERKCRRVDFVIFPGVQRLQVLRDNINDMDDGGQEAHQDQMRHIMSIMEICQ
jgi:hypothetical protein